MSAALIGRRPAPTAVLIALPTAAAAPVSNPGCRGRYPAAVVPPHELHRRRAKCALQGEALRALRSSLQSRCAYLDDLIASLQVQRAALRLELVALPNVEHGSSHDCGGAA